MVKQVLMIAYHYPPVKVSSGIQRTLKFSQYLAEFGWQPSVLTAHPRAYEAVSSDQMGEIPPQMTVCRAFALDTARHLALGGGYPDFMALPDRWVSWCLGGVPAGLKLIRRQRPSVLWSTYPIATAHLIGLALHRLTGVPWVADCRDSMTEPNYPRPPRQRRVFRWLERQMVRHASRVVFTTPGTLRMYAERYPEVPVSRWAVIGNGYDEANFTQAERNLVPAAAEDRSLLLVHSGVLYPEERDPRPFFGALADLKGQGVIDAKQVRVILRASGHDDYHRRHIEAQGIQDIVLLEPAVPYRQALQEMMAADGLLVFQSAECNHQIPAKLYEYLRAGRPILALTDPRGDTAGVLRDHGIDTLAPLDQRERIAVAFADFLARLRAGQAPVADPVGVAGHSRYAQTRELAALLDAVVAERGGA